MSKVGANARRADAGEVALPPGIERGAVFQVLHRHLQTLHALPAHGNRTLRYPTLLVALLVSAYEPSMNSLRTLDDASVSQSFMKKHLGDLRLAKSTLSDAMTSMDARVLFPILKRLLAQIPHLPRRDPDLAGLGRILAVDGSFFRLPAQVLWALNHKKVGGQPAKSVRLNLQLDVLQFLPADLSLSGQEGGSEGDAIMAQGLLPDAVYLADRGYVQMDFIRAVLAAGSDVVVRVMHSTRFAPQYTQPLDPEDREAHVLVDTIGTLPALGPRHLRIVEVHDTRNHKTVRLLTSLLDLPAHLIAKLYRYRWSIELFFRWLKCVARIKRLMSQSVNGITLQFYAAILAVLAGYLVTGVRPGLYEYHMLSGVLRGTTIQEGMLEVLARRARERQLEKIRRARKKQV